MSPAFGGAFAGRTVLVTGHTGFKGSWLSLWLKELGANVVGYALAPNMRPSIYEQLDLDAKIDSRIGDVRDSVRFEKVVLETKPEIVFHLAAQPLVRYSYDHPAETFATNVQGTVNLLDAVRRSDSVRVVTVVTTDKCYENLETDRAYKEDDRLGGRDPYSASKACAELVVASYRNSFFAAGDVSLSTARAGNVVGGGDWAPDRLIPDCVRALASGRTASIRNPRSVRPWQYVLEPLSGYLRLAARQLAEPKNFAEAWNFGPVPSDSRTTGEIADLVVRAWGSGQWTPAVETAAPHEAGQLRLDSSKAHERLDWRPSCRVDEAVARAIAWYRAAQEPGFDALAFSRRQIAEYAAGVGA